MTVVLVVKAALLVCVGTLSYSMSNSRLFVISSCMTSRTGEPGFACQLSHMDC